MFKQELEILRSKYTTELQAHGYLLAAINRYCNDHVLSIPAQLVQDVTVPMTFEQRFEGALAMYGLLVDEVIGQHFCTEHFEVGIRGIYKNDSYNTDSEERVGYFVSVKGSRGSYGQHVIDTCYLARVVTIEHVLADEVMAAINDLLCKVARSKYAIFGAPLSRIANTGHLTELITMSDWLIFRDAKGIPLTPGQLGLAASVVRYKLDSSLSDISIAGPSVNVVKTCLSALQADQLMFPVLDKANMLSIGCLTQTIDPTDLRVYASMMGTKVVQLEVLTKPPFLK